MDGAGGEFPPIPSLLLPPNNYVCDYIFSHQDGIYGFKFPSRFLEISSRDLTSFSSFSLN